MITQAGPFTMQDWTALIAAMHSGEVFEVDEEVWFYWLEVLPPIYMHNNRAIDGVDRKCSFGFAEGAEQITDFWREGGRYFGKRSERWHNGG